MKQIEGLRHAWKEGVASGDAGVLDFDDLRVTATRKLASRRKRKANSQAPSSVPPA